MGQWAAVRRAKTPVQPGRFRGWKLVLGHHFPLTSAGLLNFPRDHR